MLCVLHSFWFSSVAHTQFTTHLNIKFIQIRFRETSGGTCHSSFCFKKNCFSLQSSNQPTNQLVNQRTKERKKEEPNPFF